MATGIVTTDNLTLRKTPDSNGSPMGLLPKGTAVDTIVDDREDNITWWLVSTKLAGETRVGWVQADFIKFDQPVAGRIDWSKTPQLGASGFHNRFGGQNWRFDNNGIYLEDNPNNPIRSGGSPRTCSAILDIYGQQIFDASMKHGIPPELIVMTIATESGADRKSKFTGPPTFRWEPRPRSYSAGPMQTLASTAQEVIDKLHLNYDKEGVAPTFASEPVPPPQTLGLYDGTINIDIGTGEIKLNNLRHSTGFDPILVAACYNAGSLRQTDANPWHLFTFGDHLNRTSEWFGDACSLLNTLRGGGSLDQQIVKSDPQSVVTDSNPDEFEITGLLSDDADQEVTFFEDAGAVARKLPTPDGFFTVLVSFPHDLTTPPPQQGGPSPTFDAPTATQGYVLCIDRIRMEKRQNMNYPRTVGVYQAYFNGEKIPEISGMVCERQGPGDNGVIGQNQHQRIKAGAYPLFTHAGASGKFCTIGYTKSPAIGATPRPALRVGNTGRREGILVHPAQGYLWSIGCLNLTSPLKAAQDNIDYVDSRSRIIALIDNISKLLGDQFPHGNDEETKAVLLIRDHDTGEGGAAS
jgi:hypothetical protein